MVIDGSQRQTKRRATQTRGLSILDWQLVSQQSCHVRHEELSGQPHAAMDVERDESAEQQASRAAGQAAMALRAVLRSLQPYLAEFGFRPTRVLTFLRSKPDMEHFPAPGAFREICEFERQNRLSEASERFLEDLLSENAHAEAVNAFMEALFDANNSLENANEGAWRCHDILTMACGFLPSQEALVDYIESRHIDLDVVASSLCSIHGFLTPDNMTKVMEILQLEGRRSAAVYLFACLYTTYADTLRVEWEFDMHTENTAITDCPGPPAWLRTLLDILGGFARENVQEHLPNLQLSPDFWLNIDGQFTFRRSSVAKDIYDESGSDAGESVASDETLCEETNRRPRLTSCLSRRHRDEMRRLLNLKISYCNLDGYQHSRYNLDVYQHDGNDYVTATDDEWEEQSSVVTGTSSVSSEDNEHASIVGKKLVFNRPRQEPGEISLRAYQEELLTSTRQGISVMIFLPTGTGKTYVVLKYVQEILSRPGTERIVFLAPKVRLVQQQYNRFRSYFPDTTYARCGNSRTSSSPFEQLLDTYRIYVMTPMCLVEAISAKEVSITDFSVLVLDECHHTQRGHAYKKLMDLYMDFKYDNPGTNGPRLPQIIGLTASPGVGKGGSLATAIAHVTTLCENLDVERICTVKEHEKELKDSLNEPHHEVHRCPGRKKNTFKRIIESIMESIENTTTTTLAQTLGASTYDNVKSRLVAPTLYRGQVRYTHWVSKLSKDLLDLVQDKGLYTTLFSALEALSDYQKALILNEDCESQYALDYLLEKFDKMRSKQHRLTAADRILVQQFNEHEHQLLAASRDKDDFNPKLRMLEDILLTVLDKEEGDASAMVFVRTVELTKAIQTWIEKHPELQRLAPGRIVGSNVTAENAGMTQVQLSDVMTKFNNGDHKVVVCTSAAEEGLDFQACNVVVRYTFVTNVVSMIQTRGRARRVNSQYCVLDGQLGGCVEKEKENLASETLMLQAVQHVQKVMGDNPNDFRNVMTGHQKSQVLARKNAVSATELRRVHGGFYTSLYAFKCRKCLQKVFTSADVTRIGQGSHTLLEDRLAVTWVKAQELATARQWTCNLERVASVLCVNCGFYWGSLARYIPSGKQYPIIKLEQFVLENIHTRAEISRRVKWSEQLFHVRELTEEQKANL